MAITYKEHFKTGAKLGESPRQSAQACESVILYSTFAD